MKILQVHNIYQGKTGEETVLAEERAVLQANGHEVIQFVKDNSVINGRSSIDNLKLLTQLRSSKSIKSEFRDFLQKERPDICHVHNTFPLITPAVFQVCYEIGIPVIKTLHNYKMVCTNSLMFRNGEVCDLCLNKSLYNSIRYKCYRNSYIATAAQADVVQHHRNTGTWQKYVDRFLALTSFQKELIVNGGGLPGDKVSIKANFIAETGLMPKREDFFLFVGKVDDYKGLQDLLALFQRNKRIPFVVIGKAEDDGLFESFPNVSYLGPQDRAVTLDYMSRCNAVIFPSKYYEGMPMVILEAFSYKKPVICRNRGAMSSMIQDQSNGVHYESEDELVEIINKLNSDRGMVERLGLQAYEDYLKMYSREVGYKNLVDTYQDVIDQYKHKVKEMS